MEHRSSYSGASSLIRNTSTTFLQLKQIEEMCGHSQGAPEMLEGASLLGDGGLGHFRG